MAFESARFPVSPLGIPHKVTGERTHEAADSPTPTPPKVDRKLAIGRLVKNAAPKEDVVARILEQRAGKTPNGKEPGAEETNPQVAQQLEQIADGVGQLFDFMVAVHEQGTAQSKAFDALYNELSDYKNDFFYERLKPIMKPLLFLLDSMQEYSEEVARTEREGLPLTSQSVRAHLEHFSDQLQDVLRIAEMEPIELEGDEYNARTQRAIEVVPVDKEHDGKVQRVIRSGWTMGGTTLRPADVIVGKAG